MVAVVDIRDSSNNIDSNSPNIVVNRNLLKLQNILLADHSNSLTDHKQLDPIKIVAYFPHLSLLKH
jgi:hypothetical protein